MIRISNLSLPVDGDLEQLRKRAARALGLRPGQLGELEIVRQSIDARNRSEVHYVYTVELSMPQEERLVENAPERQAYAFPAAGRRSALPPVVVGMGPAGLFAALFLARNGFPCVVLERGQDVDQRTRDVDRFWTAGALDEGSNVQFGEGGAGTFSDGKLTTGTHDPRIAAVLDTLVEAGAPADVKYSHKPHVGTDVLRQVVKHIRQELIALGCDVRFGHRLEGLTIQGDALTGLRVAGPQGGYLLKADTLVLAPGHSARDTFAMLHQAGVPMEQKPFAVGVRIEHPRALIDRSQYGRFAGHPALGAADYKLSCRPLGGRGVYTFCMCPGGVVMAAASEEGGLVVNGMSEHARDAVNSNSALLVGVGPEDFGSAHPLAGAAFQRKIEQAAFALGGGGYRAPIQLVADFLRDQKSASLGEVEPSYRPGVTFADLRDCLPAPVALSLKAALPAFGRQLAGFDRPDAVLTGVESRSSSPVRLLRDDSGQSAVHGLFPCGEGAGYAGGIVSAAVDGVRAAEQVMRSLLGGELPNPCG